MQVIDVHHHFEPTHKNADGTAWSIDMALEQMDRNAIATAIGYCGPLFGSGAQACAEARTINEWGAQLGVDHPGRFGLFASIPMNDVDGALREIAYALDVLKADGIGLSPSYDTLWLGDPKFRPIFEELHRRKAVVYVHPAKGTCSIAPPIHDPHGVISSPWLKFPMDTAYTILSLWATGVTQALPDIRFIFCHGGGVLPILLGRIAGFSGWETVGSAGLGKIFPDGIYAAFAKLYFECAQAYAPETFAMLRALLPTSHILYGSDFSYFPIAHSIEQFGCLDLPDADRRLIAGENAATLLPRWAS